MKLARIQFCTSIMVQGLGGEKLQLTSKDAQLDIDGDMVSITVGAETTMVPIHNVRWLWAVTAKKQDANTTKEARPAASKAGKAGRTGNQTA